MVTAAVVWSVPTSRAPTRTAHGKLIVVPFGLDAVLLTPGTDRAYNCRGGLALQDIVRIAELNSEVCL